MPAPAAALTASTGVEEGTGGGATADIAPFSQTLESVHGRSKPSRRENSWRQAEFEFSATQLSRGELVALRGKRSIDTERLKCLPPDGY